MEQQTILSRRGVRARLARGLGIHASAPYQWDRVPADRLIDAARILGVHPSELRPDLYPPFPLAPPAGDAAPAQSQETGKGSAP